MSMNISGSGHAVDAEMLDAASEDQDLVVGKLSDAIDRDNQVLNVCALSFITPFCYVKLFECPCKKVVHQMPAKCWRINLSSHPSLQPLVVFLLNSALSSAACVELS